MVGRAVGREVGCIVGLGVGRYVGCDEGFGEGTGVGWVGSGDGMGDGCRDDTNKFTSGASTSRVTSVQLLASASENAALVMVAAKFCDKSELVVTPSAFDVRSTATPNVATH